MRLVLIIITYLLFIPAGNTADFSKYKSTCSDIGFTPDTDPFADCVLKLYKRDRAKTAEKNTQERENIDRSNAIERDRQAQIERDKERQAERQRQANYERERLKLEREIAARQQKRDEERQNEINNRAFWGALIGVGNQVNRDNERRVDDYEMRSCLMACQSQGDKYAYCLRTCK
jgi:hypothetical protein